MGVVTGNLVTAGPKSLLDKGFSGFHPLVTGYRQAIASCCPYATPKNICVFLYVNKPRNSS